MVMKDALTNKAQKLVAAVCLWLLFTPNKSPAQFVEVCAEVQITSWHMKDPAGQPIEKRGSFRTRCVVGTNAWSIEHDYIANGEESWWFTGSNLVKHVVITKEIPPEKMPGHRYGAPPIGQQITNFYDSMDRHLSGSLGVKLPWLAFCSSGFLKRDGRGIPVSIAGFEKDESDYSQQTSVFDDAFGLPRSVKFFSRGNQLTYEYQVEQSTNVLGWSFPLRFKMASYRLTRDGSWEPHGAASGRVTSIREGTKAQIPAREIGRGN